jgi:hypothetical protein
VANPVLHRLIGEAGATLIHLLHSGSGLIAGGKRKDLAFHLGYIQDRARLLRQKARQRSLRTFSGFIEL